MKNFIKGNWFKIIIVLLLIWLIFILRDGVEIQHRGYVNLNGNFDTTSEIEGYLESNYDGSTLYLK